MACGLGWVATAPAWDRGARAKAAMGECGNDEWLNSFTDGKRIEYVPYRNKTARSLLQPIHPGGFPSFARNNLDRGFTFANAG